MDVHDWVTISSVATRDCQKRMEYRLDALHSFLPAFFAITENRVSGSELGALLAQANTKFQLYCNKDEVAAFVRLTNACRAQDNEAYTDAVRDLARLVREGIRDELGLDAYEYPN